MTGPTIHKIRKVSSIAGQTQYAATVQYPGEEVEVSSFVGTVGETGGVVVAISPGGHQQFVTDPGRLGPFGPEWVRAFYA